jgi:hypothetical protein
MFTKHWKHVPHGVTATLWDSYLRIVHLIYIYVGNLIAPTVGSIKVRQLGIKNGCLQFVDTAVSTDIVKDIFS